MYGMYPFEAAIVCFKLTIPNLLFQTILFRYDHKDIMAFSPADFTIHNDDIRQVEDSTISKLCIINICWFSL